MTGPYPSTPAPTIYDVARAADVAPSTVSRAFSRPGRVSAGTVTRIRAVADELGYHPNPIARALSTSRTHMIAVIVSDVGNPFHAELVRGAQEAARNAGFVVILGDAQESGVREREALDRVLPVVEGAIIGSSRMTDAALRDIAGQRPTIVLNREVDGVASIVTDNPGGTRAAVGHLRGLGHRAITYVAGPEASWADSVRWASLCDAAREHGLETRRIGPVAPTFEGGLDAAAGLVRGRPTAVIAYNDLVAIGVLQGLARAGVRVPDEVSVVGFDDILTSRLVTPALTTVAAPIGEMGAAAVRELLALSEQGPSDHETSIVMPARLVIRESTGRRRDA